MITQKGLKTTRLIKKTKKSFKTIIDFDNDYSGEKIITYPHQFTTHKQIITRKRKLEHTNTRGSVVEYLFDGICIEEREVQLGSPMQINVKHSFPYLKMHFEITGHSSYIPNDKKSLSVEIIGGHHQLFFFPKVDGILSYPSNTVRKTLEITLSLNFIKQAFKNNWEILESFGEALFENKPIVFGKKSKSLTPDITSIIQQITTCKLPDHLKRAYLKSKVTELLILQLYHLNNINDSEKELLPENYDKIIKAKEYLLQNINLPITIQDISERIGLNTNQVKKGFNEIYNKPFFQYLTSLRMKKSIYLLEESTDTIAEIANHVGYTYSQHFSKTFKKYYGITPKQYRNSSRSD